MMKCKSRSTQSIRAVITRADGTIEDLGLIGYSSTNPIKQLAWNIYSLAKKYFNLKGK